jgi:hypothetical protein
MNSIIPGPVPPYSNPPIEPQYYSPIINTITAVNLGTTTTITVQNNTQLQIGSLVRLIIPSGWGCVQLNEKTGYVISIPSTTQVIVNLDSSQNVDPFKTGPSTSTPQIQGIGDINSGQINSFGRIKNLTYINGSYINISPV